MVRVVFRVLLFLLFLACGYGGLKLAELLKDGGPGYVLIYFNHYSVETSFWIFIVGMVGFAIITLGLVWLVFNGGKLLIKLGLLPRRFSTGQSRRLQQAGLLAFADQNYVKAGKELRRAGKNADMPFVDFLYSARSALVLNQIDDAEAAFKKARDCADKDDLAIALFAIDMAQALNDDAKAQQRLEEARSRYETDPRFVIKAAAVYHSVGQWESLQPLLKPLTKKQLVNKALLQTYATDGYAGLLAQTARHKDLSALNKWFKQAQSYQLDERVYMAYFEGLITLGEAAEARGRIERQLKQHWNETLLRLYLTLPAAHASEQQQFVDGLSTAQAGNPTLLYAQGLVASRNADWLVAKKHLEQSLAIHATAEAWFTLAQVYAGLHQPSEQTNALNQGLLLLNA